MKKPKLSGFGKKLSRALREDMEDISEYDLFVVWLNVSNSIYSRMVGYRTTIDLVGQEFPQRNTNLIK